MHLLAQITPPPDLTSPYAWIAGVALSALGVLFFKYDGRQAQSILDWKTAAKESAAELKANTASVGKLTDALAAVGQSNVKLTESVDRLERRMERIEMGLGADRTRPSP